MPEITNICICRLPYQDHWFVHGERNGEDVWLRNDGTWTADEEDPTCELLATLPKGYIVKSDGSVVKEGA